MDLGSRNLTWGGFGGMICVGLTIRFGLGVLYDLRWVYYTIFLIKLIWEGPSYGFELPFGSSEDCILPGGLVKNDDQ